MRKTAIISLAAVLLVALSGCTPPMPPELRIAQEEQSFQCVDGTTKISFPESIADIGGDYADALSTGCSGMAMTIANGKEKPQIAIGSTDPKICTPYLTVPFALDAAVVVVNEPDLSSLNLDLQTVSDIFDGKITAWNDPEIAKLNPDSELPAVAISIFPAVQTEALNALKSWAKIQGVNFTGSLLKPTDAFSVTMADKLKDNQIAIFPYSINSVQGIVTASIVSDAKHLSGAANTDSANIASAATQLVVNSSPSEVTLRLDPNLKPIPPLGSDVAPAPYEAIYAVNMSLCGTDSLTTRAAARFMLRQDSQGSLGSSNLLPLSEAVRIAAIQPVSKGLPKVKIKPPAN